MRIATRRCLVVLVAGSFLVASTGEVLAQRGSSSPGSSSSSSSSRGSSFGGGSKSSGSSTPHFSGGSSSRSGSTAGASRSYGGSSTPAAKTPVSGVSSHPGVSATVTRPSAGSTAGASRSYGGSTTASRSAGSTAGSSVKPSLGSSSTGAQQRTESRLAYQKATAPRTTYTRSDGSTARLDTSSPSQQREVDRLRSQVDYHKMETRIAREDASYYRWRSSPPVYYGDPYHGHFNNLFLTWAIMDQARYIAQNQAIMDQARLNALYAANPGLQQQVVVVRQQGVPQDWRAPIDEDLAFTNDYVAAASGYNAAPVSTTTTTYARPYNGPTVLGVLKFVFWCVVFGASGYLVYYSVFRARW